jgi:hypothetical protein
MKQLTNFDNSGNRIDIKCTDLGKHLLHGEKEKSI